MKELKIDEEFKSLIPPLSTEEYNQLEENIKVDGCRDPLVVWNGFIIDGHNRYEICTKNNIEFKVVNKKDLDSSEAVKLWMIHNQYGRRNLTAFTRSELALVEKAIIAKKAKEKQSEAGGAVSQKSDKAVIDTKKELAKNAGVSHDTIHKVEKIKKVATQELQDTLRTEQSGVSINLASKVAQEEPELQKVFVKKVESGVKATKAFEEIKQEQKEAEKEAQIEASKDVKIKYTVINGDSTIETENAPYGIKCVVTDPPYGMAFVSNRRTSSAKDNGIANDESIDQAIKVTKTVFNNLYKKMDDNSSLFCFIGWREEPHFRGLIEDCGFTIKNSIIWVKQNHGTGDLKGSFAPKHERIVFAVKGKPELSYRHPDVINGIDTRTEHPTAKPIDLIKKLIESTTKTGDIVADPFAGHGSTLISAKESNRNLWGCELDEYNHSCILEHLNG